jgi:hypothetical protein
LHERTRSYEQMEGLQERQHPLLVGFVRQARCQIMYN